MPTTQTIRRLPPTRHANLTDAMNYWEDVEGIIMAPDLEAID